MNLYSKLNTVILILLILFILILGCSEIDFNALAMNIVFLRGTTRLDLDWNFLYPWGDCQDTKLNQISANVNLPVAGSLYLQGLVAFRNHDLNTAEELLLHAFQNGINPEVSAYALGVVKLMRGQDPRPYWRYSESALRFLTAGRECIVVGQREKADDYYRAALDVLHERHVDGFRQLAEFFADSGEDDQFQKALDMYLATAEPGSNEYYRTLARVYSSRGQYDQSLDNYKRVLEMNPNDASAWYETGQAWMAEGDLINSRKALLEAIDLNPFDPSYYIYLGHTYRAEQRYDDAEKWYKAALRLDSTNAWAMSSLTDVRMAQGRYREALDLTVRAMAFDDRAYLPAKAAEALIALKNWGEARKYLAIALGLEPDNLKYVQLMAVVCEQLQDRVCLNKVYMGIIDLDPSNSEIKRKLDMLQGDTP